MLHRARRGNNEGFFFLIRRNESVNPQQCERWRLDWTGLIAWISREATEECRLLLPRFSSNQIVLCLYRATEQLHSPSGAGTWRVPLQSVPVSRFSPEEQHPFLLRARVPHQQQGHCFQVSSWEVDSSNPRLHPYQR